MKVALIPLDIVEANVKQNLENVANLCQQVDKDCDILVLPELFSTAFPIDMDLFRSLGEPMNGPTMTTLRQLAIRNNFAIAGSFLCRDSVDNTLRNRAFFINPDDGGNIAYYDKRHLFTLSPEHTVLTAGKQLSPIIHYRGWNIALSVCFDMRFPVWCRNIDNRYDMMIVPANWPDTRSNAWKSLLTARAIENIAYYVGCNRSGIDKFGIYSYLTSIAIDFLGKFAVRPHGSTIVRYATFSLEQLNEFRQKFPVFKAADKFIIEDL